MKSKTLVFNHNGVTITTVTTDPSFLFDEKAVVSIVDTDKKVKAPGVLKNHVSLKDFVQKNLDVKLNKK